MNYNFYSRNKSIERRIEGLINRYWNRYKFIKDVDFPDETYGNSEYIPEYKTVDILKLQDKEVVFLETFESYKELAKYDKKQGSLVLKNKNDSIVSGTDEEAFDNFYMSDDENHMIELLWLFFGFVPKYITLYNENEPDKFPDRLGYIRGVVNYFFTTYDLDIKDSRNKFFGNLQEAVISGSLEQPGDIHDDLLTLIYSNYFHNGEPGENFRINRSALKEFRSKFAPLNFEKLPSNNDDSWSLFNFINTTLKDFKRFKVSIESLKKDFNELNAFEAGNIIVFDDYCNPWYEDPYGRRVGVAVCNNLIILKRIEEPTSNDKRVLELLEISTFFNASQNLTDVLLNATLREIREGRVERTVYPESEDAISNVLPFGISYLYRSNNDTYSNPDDGLFWNNYSLETLHNAKMSDSRRTIRESFVYIEKPQNSFCSNNDLGLSFVVPILTFDKPPVSIDGLGRSKFWTNIRLDEKVLSLELVPIESILYFEKVEKRPPEEDTMISSNKNLIFRLKA